MSEFIIAIVIYTIIVSFTLSSVIIPPKAVRYTATVVFALLAITSTIAIGTNEYLTDFQFALYGLATFTAIPTFVASLINILAQHLREKNKQ